jgi:uncharacterized protein (TIGR04222 family)
MTLNPFNWTAGPFLTLYVSLAALLFMLGFRLKSMIGPAAQVTHELSVLELAYLAGGARRLGDAALLRLTSGNGATIDPNGQTITVTNQMPLASLMNRSPRLSFEPGMSRQQFQKAIVPLVERAQARLQELGYAPSDEQMASFRMSVLPFVALLVVFGLIKVMVGAERHHPVEILGFLLVATVIAGFVVATRPTRTQAGNDALKAYQLAHGRASRAPLEHELLLAVALSGAVVLAGTAHAPVYAASQTMSSGGGGGNGCGGSGCGGGGGGGGCGGCS